MPDSLPTCRFGSGLLSAFILMGCFGSEPDDSPYTVHRGESFEDIQLEIEAGGTPVLVAQVAMYMAHKDPDPANPEELRVQPQNFRSILLRRSTGGWSATPFKNLQSNSNAFPALIPDTEGSYQAFISDGKEIKRYVFGNGGWNRANGTEWLNGVERWRQEAATRNWNRYPRIAVTGTDLLLTLHTDWGGTNWVMEGANRQVTLFDSGRIEPIAFHVAPGYRSLAAKVYHYKGGMGGTSSQLLLYRWSEGANKADKEVIGYVDTPREACFTRYLGRTAFFASTQSGEVLIYSLDDSGRVERGDTLSLPNIEDVQFSMLALDTGGCLQGFIPQADTGAAHISLVHWNGCSPEAADTLVLAKPDPGKRYWSDRAKLRIAPDGTPVAAWILREVMTLSDFEQNLIRPSFLYFSEYRAGGWRTVKLDERRPPIPAGNGG